jgi:hypothetical protein
MNCRKKGKKIYFGIYVRLLLLLLLEQHTY